MQDTNKKIKTNKKMFKSENLTDFSPSCFDIEIGNLLNFSGVAILLAFGVSKPFFPRLIHSFEYVSIKLLYSSQSIFHQKMCDD